MKLKVLLKQIPIYQKLILLENGQEIASGHPQYIDVISNNDKTVGLIKAEGDSLKINVYDRSKQEN